jgi:hypothetical protein
MLMVKRSWEFTISKNWGYCGGLIEQRVSTNENGGGVPDIPPMMGIGAYRLINKF